MDESFFKPVVRILRDHCRSRLETAGLSDEQFLTDGLRRVLSRCD